MKDTLIEWCDRTDNIVEGCDIAAPECANCYAVDVATRFSGYAPTVDAAGEILLEGGKPVSDLSKPLHYHGLAQRSGRRGLPMWTGTVALRPEVLEACVRSLFNTPELKRTFWVSMGDIFHAEVPDSYLDEAFGGAAVLGQHVVIAVTKRPDRAARYTNGADVERRVRAAAERWWARLGLRHRLARETPFLWPGWPLPGVHLMTSAGSQETAEKFLPHLREAKAAVKGVSCEPLIAPVRFDDWLDEIDWLIIGGESGRKARDCQLDWMLDVAGPARAHGGTAVFVKQMGKILAHRLGMKVLVEVKPRGKMPALAAGPVRRILVADTKGKSFDLFPAPLRVREFPDPQPPARTEAA